MCCLLACFHHDVNSELEVAERQPFRGKKKKKTPTLGKSRCRWGKGQLRVPQQRTRCLKMKRKMAAGGNSFGESPEGKAGVRVKLGPSRKRKAKKHRLRQFPAEIPVGIASHFFFF